MNGKTVWYFTLHEVRTLKKLMRTHVFAWVALIVSTAYFLAVTLNHMSSASSIPMLGVISPRYIMSLLGGSFLVLYCIGVLVLTFDQIKRDAICRIHEVVSSKPASNLELFLGRLLGVSLTMAVPMLLFLFAIVIYGVIAEMFSIPFGEPVEIWSVISFTFLDIVPNFLFFGSLVVLFSSLFKSRLLALLLTLCCLFTLFWFNSALSFDISKPIQTVSGNVLYPSELVPTFFTPFIVCNRIALLLMSIGFLYWVSFFGSRVTPSKSKDLLFGSLSFCIGVLVISAMFGVQALNHKQVNLWVKVHDEHFEPRSFPDVHEISGTIDIHPGRSLVLNLTIDVSVGNDHNSAFVLFSFNPGFDISHLSVAGTKVHDYEFRHGLLKVPRQYFFTTETNEMIIAARGRPNENFAYLDSFDTLSQFAGSDVRQLRQLGTANSIFRPEFVALLPGIKWYPMSGTATNEDLWEHRKKDFFTLDVQVSVPRKWLVAGPAKRVAKDDNRRSTYSFQQSSPVPNFALIGSRFESGSIEVEGVWFEILYSKVHRKTFEPFGEIESNIRTRVQRIVESVRDHGLDYPYGSFTLVEVPSTLRVFGGGLSKETVMCPPGMVMIRESTLPTVSLETIVEGNREELSESFSLTDLDWLAWQVGAMSRYLSYPEYESNIDFGFYRSILGQQMGATQDGARALGIFFELLVGTIFSQSDSTFEFDVALDRDFLDLANVNPLSVLLTYLNRDFENLELEMYKTKLGIRKAPEVLNLVEISSLYESVEGEDSLLRLRALRTRIQQIVQYLLDTFGTEALVPVLVDMSQNFRGKNIVFQDFVDAFAEHNIDLHELVGDLLGTEGLPGFIASNPSSRPLEGEGESTYETSFVLQNGEPVSGPVQLALKYQNVNERIPSSSLPPILVGANQSLQIVFESLNPVQQIWVKPYLALNRMNIRVDLPISEELKELDYVRGEVPFIKYIDEIVRPQSENSSITIDDLDPGFSVIDDSGTTAINSALLRFIQRMFDLRDVPKDHGLPVFQLSNHWQFDRIWLRKTDPTAFGKYRRTFALVTQGVEHAFAKFSTELPKLGAWQLEYFLPKGFFYEEFRYRNSVSGWSSWLVPGTTHLDIHIGSKVTSRTLDAPNLDPGWHSIGTFNLTDPAVDVLISNKTDRSNGTVFADAIRWTPIDTKE